MGGDNVGGGQRHLNNEMGAMPRMENEDNAEGWGRQCKVADSTDMMVENTGEGRAGPNEVSKQDPNGSSDESELFSDDNDEGDK